MVHIFVKQIFFHNDLLCKLCYTKCIYYESSGRQSFMDTKRAFGVRLGNARNGSCFGFVAVQVMNSNRGNEREYFTAR